MKRLLLMTCLMAVGMVSYAQKDHRLYKFDHKEDAKEVYRYGQHPEFPFLRNIFTPRDFVTAMHRPHGRYDHELNNILMAIGFKHGAADVAVADVEQQQITDGTTGNMGDGGYTYMYAKLHRDGDNIMAWRITGPQGYVYFLSKCGNAFYPDAGVSPAAAKAAEAAPAPSPVVAKAPVCRDKVYIYYGGMKDRAHGWDVYADDMETQKCSKPYDLSAVQRAEQEPSMTYDAKDIQVEKISAYLGFKPAAENTCMSRGGYKEFKRAHRRHCGCRW